MSLFAVTLFVLCIFSGVIAQAPCGSNSDFGISYDSTGLVFSVSSANSTCWCKNLFSHGTGYFGGDVTLASSSQINFANGLGQKVVLWSAGSPTAYYGFGISSNTLEYHTDTSSSDHVFYQGTTELFRIAGDGEVTAQGTLGVSAASTFGSASVIGAATLSSTAAFTGLPTFNGGLRVAAGATQLLGGLTASGAATLAATTFSGPVTRSSTSSFSGLATFNGGLFVWSGSSAVLSGTLTVAGASTFSSTLTVGSGASINVIGGGGVTAGPGSFTSLTVSGSSSFGPGAVSVTSTLGVSGLITAAAGVSVTGGALTVASTTNFNSNANVAGAMTSSGQLRTNNGINIRFNTVVDFGVGASREASAGKMGYGIFSGGGGLDMVGAGTSSGNRQINMWDNVLVQSNFETVGTASAGTTLAVSGITTVGGTTNVVATGGGIVLQRPAYNQGWNSASRNSYDAHIVNDYGPSYNSLMIVGSSPSGGTRVVQMWDQLNVNGNFIGSGTGGSMSVTGAFTTANTRSWRVTDNRPSCPTALCAGCAQMTLSIPLSQAAHVMITGTNIRLYAGRADLCLIVDGSVVNQHITYTQQYTWVSGTVHWSGQLSAATHTVYIADCSGFASIWGCGPGYGSITAVSIG